MSIAGIRSNRGDGYQNLVALDWALTVLSDPSYQWVEVDSVSYVVDDIVIGKSDGSVLCCQCKKNQIDFKYWTIATLADELEKAAELLAGNNNAQDRFYSRSPFSTPAKLREYAAGQPSEESYQKNLTAEHKTIDSSLAKIIARQLSTLSTYDFLLHTTFETSPELDRMEDGLRERLRFLVSSTSAIGRSWQREISGHKIDSSVAGQILDAIDSDKRSILLTGLPGSGKTCVMLEVQEVLEQREQTQGKIIPLFIQAREFADATTSQERHAQGLPEHWVEQAARIADYSHLIIVIDSLDVLSIAREHSVLTYFLTQIDRLLLIPGVTVITACRDFDRHYDHRIAERRWDFELSCQPLDWTVQIKPLLTSLQIDTETIDAATRELIQNPRELSLFVELAQIEGSFNVVTSQALAQRYIDNIIRKDSLLGESAIQAIESMADEMLRTRSLSISSQRLYTTSEIKRSLLSQNILRETQDRGLIFGHQTLLDVLVISGAIRQGTTLNWFIQSLPPVPFVRPSIRSFVAQLSIGNRSAYRKQLRAVLSSNAAFHLRRLVAESFAEQKPHDTDWPLIRDMYYQHREIFQVIYTQAKSIEWHYFWLKHLYPIWLDEQDGSALGAHVYRVSQWLNDDTHGVIQFWQEALLLDWLDRAWIANRIEIYLLDIHAKSLPLIVPLVEQLLLLPRRELGFLGQIVARCVDTNAIDDTYLWSYIAGEITDEDLHQYNFNNKLHCKPNDFDTSNDSFLSTRMSHSSHLLDTAVQSIEQWNLVKTKYWSSEEFNFRNVFLCDSSHHEIHSKHDIIVRHSDGLGTLLDSIESAILEHASKQSKWWLNNRKFLSNSHEAAFRYFAVKACTANPQDNTEIIGRMLTDKEMLESSLSYVLGNLIKQSFIFLDPVVQDDVLRSVMTIWDEEVVTDEQQHLWVLKKRANFIAAIPCHLRSANVQVLFDEYEQKAGALIRQPEIWSSGGTVSAPFSYHVFLDTNNTDILKLLTHYSNYTREYDDVFIGGKREVGQQFHEAASRHPERLLSLFKKHWEEIDTDFCDDLMSGVARYLSGRHGNLSTNSNWEPVDEPIASELAELILDELERHSQHWRHNRAASDALQACSHVIENTKTANRLVFLALDYLTLDEESSIQGDSVDNITAGINMKTGHVAEALMILANRFLELNIDFPDLLAPTLQRFSNHHQHAIRALILRRLPYLNYKRSELGWDLFQRATQDSESLWSEAERCLYYTYRNDYDKVAPALERILQQGNEADKKVWGRISALSCFAKQTQISDLLSCLRSINSVAAWKGAASVWCYPTNILKHREICFSAIKEGLDEENANAEAIAKKVLQIFNDDEPLILLPIELISKTFFVLSQIPKNDQKGGLLSKYGAWASLVSQRNPELALSAVERYLSYVKTADSSRYIYDHGDNFTQLLTRLFAEAEELEESDQGSFLKRVVVIQDLLLALGMDGINTWLKAAERP